MSEEFQFECPLANGIHARPASALEELASRFVSAVAIVNGRNQIAADAKSVLSIVSADIRSGDPCTVTVTGSDETTAAEELRGFLTDILPHADDSLAAEEAESAGMALPACLRNSGATLHPGHGAVPGIGIGTVVVAGGMDFTGEWVTARAADPAAEEESIRKSVAKVTKDFDRLLEGDWPQTERGLMQAHRSIARDAGLLRRMLDFVSEYGRTAAGAIAGAAEHYSSLLAASTSRLLRERALDVQDVCMKLLREVPGGMAHETSPHLTADAIVLAETLSPGQLLALDRDFLKGLVLTQIGPMSHAVILARSAGVPTLTGAGGDIGPDLAGQEAIVDGDLGFLVTAPDEAARRYYQMEQRRIDGRKAALARLAAAPGQLRDGRKLEVAANIASPEDAAAAFAAGADGIGLFRTEMLFCDRAAAPTEEEQYLAYRSVLEASNGKPVIIRTLDIGGDKPAAYLDLPHEENPFLGCRGARVYQKYEALLHDQLRAIVRASAHGPAWLMVPMVSTVREMRGLRALTRAVQADCEAKGIAYDPEMPIGAMIEVPAAAYAIDELSREADFFSIGSNDLLQYFMAADRGNPAVAALYHPLHPPFLRFLKSTVEAARANGKWIGLCGEMGGDLRCLPLLAGMGFDEISAAIPAIAGIKAELARLGPGACEELLAGALHCDSAEAVEGMLASFTGSHSEPLLAPELIVRDVDAASEEEAIKQAVDLLYIHGRTERPRELEDAVWAREDAFSTGFGHGFAFPHCKSDTILANSLAVLRLRAPVDWRARDGPPVRVVLLFAVREADAATEHMRVISKLARAVMDEDFRMRLENEEDAETLCAFLMETLEG